MITEMDYHGWNAFSLETGKAKLVVPADIGPRILYCGLAGGPNLFSNVSDQLGGREESEWKIRGGHRLWQAPEDPVGTYALDNSPIEVSVLPNDSGLLLEQSPGESTGIKKTIRLEVLGDTSFKLTHTLINSKPSQLECAAWSLSVMQRGGYATIPLLPKGSHPENLSPTYHLIPWSYTDLGQPCWCFHRDFIGVDTTRNAVPQKLGISNYPGWLAYWQEGGTFVKYSPLSQGAAYPDFGSVMELFCNDWMLEMETLSPLSTLEPGGSITHVEYWSLFAGLPRPDTDAAFTDKLRPVIENWLSEIS